MLNKKNIITLGLATVIGLTPMVINADKIETKDNKEVEIETEIEDSKDYIQYNAKIKEINEKGSSLLVEGAEDEETFKELVLNLDEDILIYNTSKKEAIKVSDLEKGDIVNVFYKSTIPVASSLPAQLTPELIVKNDSETLENVKLDNFNKNLISSDNKLKLLLNKEVEIVDGDNNKLTEKEVKDSKALVFFTTSTKSIPAQTTPLKVVILNKETEEVEEKEIKEMSKIFINGEEIKLKSEMYKSDKTIMIPLRQIVEELGYVVKWDGETKSVEVSKGAQWTSITIDKNSYTFGKMAAFELEEAPELKEETTFVPVSFLEEVLKLEEIDISESGILNIK